MTSARKGSQTRAGLEMGMLSATRKVIPLYYQSGEDWHTDIKLPDLVIDNGSDDEVSLLAVTLRVTAGDEEVATFSCGGAAIERAVKETNTFLGKLIRMQPGPWRENNHHMLFAVELPAGDAFEATLPLKPSAKTCLRLDDLFVFHYVGRAKADGVVCTALASVGGKRATLEFPIPLTPYECKGEYTFPLRGSLTIGATAWNREGGHRRATNQEFAFDVEDLRRGDDGAFAASCPPASNNIDDYYICNREVRAIGDGVVVNSGNRWPDACLRNPLEYSVKRVLEQTEKLLEAGVPFEHALLGNYAVIDHGRGEFSLYAHMREGSVCVAPGDRVRRGQVIGRVGNTSNSTAPHLHFQLMDSPSANLANGLPVRFIDLPTELAADGEHKQANPLLYSDRIFTRVPD